MIAISITTLRTFSVSLTFAVESARIVEEAFNTHIEYRKYASLTLHKYSFYFILTKCCNNCCLPIIAGEKDRDIIKNIKPGRTTWS